MSLNNLYRTIFLTLLASVLHITKAVSQFTLDNNLTLEQMIVDNFVGSPSVQISNVQLITGDLRQVGYFYNANSNLTISEGLLLTTGFASEIPITGINTGSPDFSAGRVNCLSQIGCPNEITYEPLNELVPNGLTTKDPIVIQFDFSAPAQSVSFDYVFASEEYGDFTCSPNNDIFAFFIEGISVPLSKRNIALIPGSNLPVAVNSINNGRKGTESSTNLINCTEPFGSTSFSQYFVENSPGSFINFDGLTTVLTATTEIIPCETYRLTIAIADVNDNLLSSGIFLQSNSFIAEDVVIQTEGTYEGNLFVEDCNIGSVVFEIPENPLTTPLTYPLTFSGSAIKGVDYDGFPEEIVFQPGQTRLEIPFNIINDGITEGNETIEIAIQFLCSSSEPLILNIIDKEPDVTPILLPTDIQCDKVLFRWAPNNLLSSDYQISEDNGLNWINPTGNFQHTINQADGNTVSFSLRQKAPFDCYVKPIVTTSAVTNQFEIVNSSKDNISCFAENDGNINLEINSSLDFQTNWNDGVEGILNRSNLSSGQYVVTITNEANCSIRTTFTITEPSALNNILSKTDETCDGDNNGSITINATGGVTPYQYFINNNPTQNVRITGLADNTYSIKVVDANNCSISQPATVNIGNKVTFSLDLEQPECSSESGGGLIINPAIGGTSPYLYTLNNQVTPTTVTNLVPNSYVVEVTDAVGCMSSTFFTIGSGVELTFKEDIPSYIEKGEEVFIAVNSNINRSFSFQWFPSQFVNCFNSSCNIIEVLPDSTTTFIYSAIDQNGCSYQDSITIIVGDLNDALYIPNAFSPNGDGINDLFEVQVRDVVNEISQMIIFNRWGEVVYQANDFNPNYNNIGWDGKMKGQDLLSGIYIYIVEVQFVDGSSKLYKGDLTLMR